MKERLIRIQRKRTKGWRMPSGTIYVGRPGIWGNPFIVGIDGTPQECVDRYAKLLLPYNHQPPNNSMENYLTSEINLQQIESELRGKNLACWCRLDQPCHADFLLRVANVENNTAGFSPPIYFRKENKNGA